MNLKVQLLMFYQSVLGLESLTLSRTRLTREGNLFAKNSISSVSVVMTTSPTPSRMMAPIAMWTRR